MGIRIGRRGHVRSLRPSVRSTDSIFDS
ncbi:MAG: hypothetical protein QOE14_953, partial [Humisphaera sp.]|nr:hypothetical protein [Humisphaera sp.]